MLKLERMQISGFKSFSDRTEVGFPSGITCVVGPNGCGKSNIGDAINWVLGEQSPRMLRGKQMADVIFSGSEARKPVGMAEVSIHLAGAEGLLHAEQGKVVLTRRLFRSGESDYLLNGKRARLKDIQDLLDQARVGARSYATIEQGKIDQILNARPKDRRQIIEDAAGISGYKHKRRLTELKLEATHANLLRVNDIVVEVERQIRSLKRQAAKARRYRKLRDQLRQKERIRFGRRARAMDGTLNALRQAENAARDAEAEANARLARAEAELDREREALEQANQVFRRASEQLHQLDIEIDREESRIRGLREKIEENESASRRQAEEAARLVERREATRTRNDEQRALVEAGRTQLERLEQVLTERHEALAASEQNQRQLREAIEGLRGRQFESMNRLAELRNDQRSTEDALGRNRTQRERLEQERSRSRDDLSRIMTEASSLAEEAGTQREIVEQREQALAACEEQLVLARQRLSSRSEELSAGREQEQSSQARLRTLEDVATRFAGVSDGVRALLTSGPASGIRAVGVVADFIEAGRDVESVAEGYLSTLLPTVIVEDDSDVQRAAAFLRSAGAGRTSLISRSQPVGRPAVGTHGNGHGEIPREIVEDSRVNGRLLDRLTLNTAANGTLRERVGDAMLVESLEAALDLHRRYPDADYLTPQGDVVYSSGLVAAGGQAAGDRGLLAHTRQTHEAQATSSQASARVAELRERVEACRREVGALEDESNEHRGAVEVAARRLVALEMQAQRFSDDSERTGRRTEVLADELAVAEEEAQRLALALRELTAGVQSAEQAGKALETELGSRTAVLETGEAELRRLNEEVTGVRADLAALRQRQQTAEQERCRLADEAAELDARIAALTMEADTALGRAAAARESLIATERTLLEHLEQRETSRAQNAETERRIAEMGRELADGEQALRRIREELSGLGEATHHAELDRARTEAEREHLDDLCTQELALSAAEAADVAEAAGVVLEEVDPEQLDREVEEIRGNVEKIGPVNMTAIEEFAELEERHGFLTSQRDDLERSMASLRETIRRINRTSRERFVEAFDAIRTSFQTIFQLLFNGGRADLRLEEEQDVLECGIEIMVQPPGKRLGSIQLMSGGEKALSAIALLFAVFRFQPSPFCLLDEVDAALDDANVTRFARMVREYADQTQFILITHNKLSMESADLLYGVTMEEPGVSKLVSLQLQ